MGTLHIAVCHCRSFIFSPVLPDISCVALISHQNRAVHRNAKVSVTLLEVVHASLTTLCASVILCFRHAHMPQPTAAALACSSMRAVRAAPPGGPRPSGTQAGRRSRVLPSLV
jgi:hypothetical protein